MAFTKLQEKFINIYSRMRIDPEQKPNGTKAAIGAGYSERGASVAATTLLANPKILDAVESRVAELNGKLDNSAVASAQEVLEYMTRAKRFRQTENWKDGSMKPLEDIEVNADLIESIKTTTRPDGTITQEIKTVSKAKMVELLARHHKLLTEIIEDNRILPKKFEKILDEMGEKIIDTIS